MKYVAFGRTWHDPKQFEDRILPQDEFIAKFGKPNNTGNVMIDNEIFSVYTINLSLSETVNFLTNYRKKHKCLGYAELS